MFGKLKIFNLGDLYEKFYSLLCGNHPYYRPWHFQWHFTNDLHKWQKEKMKLLKGKLLDVGCGDKPYESWLDRQNVSRYIGLDIVSNNFVDLVVKPNEIWKIPTHSVDSVMLLQSLEHFEHLDHTLNEVNRVLKPDGLILITVPFLFPEHGAPFDFRRFTTFGLKKLLDKNFEILALDKVGLAGSVMSTFFLTFINNTLNSNFILRLIKGILMPIWIILAFVVNFFGVLVNKIDNSKTHYCNTCMIARKKIL